MKKYEAWPHTGTQADEHGANAEFAGVTGEAMTIPGNWYPKFNGFPLYTGMAVGTSSKLNRPLGRWSGRNALSSERFMRYLIRVLGVISFFISVSCTTTIPSLSSHLQEGTLLIPGVPFYQQDDFQCGPAALATVMNYWYARLGSKDPLAPGSIGKEIYSPTAKGVLGVDLELYAKRHGFSTSQYSGSLQDLRKLIDEKTPVLILVDFGIGVLQVNHFLVITGYTPNGVVANTGRAENEPISARRLEPAWKKTGYWTLVVKPLG